jgi:hypothetical protein
MPPKISFATLQRAKERLLEIKTERAIDALTDEQKIAEYRSYLRTHPTTRSLPRCHHCGQLRKGHPP